MLAAYKFGSTKIHATFSSIKHGKHYICQGFVILPLEDAERFAAAERELSTV